MKRRQKLVEDSGDRGEGVEADEVSKGNVADEKQSSKVAISDEWWDTVIVRKTSCAHSNRDIVEHSNTARIWVLSRFRKRGDTPVGGVAHVHDCMSVHCFLVTQHDTDGRVGQYT